MDLHKYLNSDEEEEDTHDGEQEYILLDVDQLPIFSVASAAAKDDLSDFLSPLSPKTLLEKIGPDEVWADDQDIRRAYHYGRVALSCSFQRDTQSCIPSDADVIQAEAFVHPVLNSHSNPQRILFLSPNPYLAVREALKYTSVKEVVCVGYDIPLFPQIEQFMGDSYMNDVLNSKKKVSFVHTLAEDYMTEKKKRLEKLYEDEVKAKSEAYQTIISMLTFDAIFIHVPHTNHNGRIENRYKKWLTYDFQVNVRFLLNEWSDDGIVVMNMGKEPGLDGGDKNELETERSEMLRMMYDKGWNYLPIIIYDEPRAAPYDTSFITFFHNMPDSHRRFIRQNAGAITLDLASNLESSDVSKLPTRFYDGTTHKTYQRSSRAWEEWSCRYPPFNTHKMCTTYRSQLFHSTGNVNNSTVVVATGTKGRILQASEFIPAGKFLNIEDAATSLYVDKHEMDLLNMFVEKYPDTLMYAALRDLIFNYGYESISTGRLGWVVSIANVNTFINHGCTKEEFTVGSLLKRDEEDFHSFSPLLSRHVELLNNGIVVERDIEAGEEIMQDYSEMSDEIDGYNFVEFSKKMCGDHAGFNINDIGDLGVRFGVDDMTKKVVQKDSNDEL